MKRYFWVVMITVFIVQDIGSQNLVNIDDKPIHFGFTLGLNTMDYGIKTVPTEINGKMYEADVTTLVPGFTVGVIGDLRLGRYFNLRLIPALHLSQRDLSYFNNQDDKVETLNIKSNVLTVPLYLKYSAARIKNYRPYLIAGGGLAFDLGREREKPLLLKQMDYFVDFGVGCTFYFPFFRLSPEIKFAMGFNDIHTPLADRPDDHISEDNRFFTEALKRLTSRLFTFTFNFE